MDAKGKKEALRILDKINPYGNTNLWEGLSLSLDEMRTVLNDSSNKFNLLLTDGEPSGYTNMLSLNGMKVTPWHPIRINDKGTWNFPAKIGTVILVECDYVYNFVLDKHHIMTINGIDVITLGHEIKSESNRTFKNPFRMESTEILLIIFGYFFKCSTLINFGST